MKKISDYNKNNNRKGFTLVELLAVIAILAAIMSIVIFVGIEVVRTAKDKSYQVTISNIETEAGNYVIENHNRVSWEKNDATGKESVCITV